MNSARQKPPAPWPLMLLFVLISICVIVVGILYYNNQKENLLKEKQQELSAISDLKIRQITQWRTERLGNAKFLGDNTLLVRIISEFLKKTSNKTLHENVLQSLKSLTENYDYKNVFLIDTGGNVRMAFPGKDTLIGDQLRPLLAGIIKKREVILTDLHRANLVSYVHLDLIIPLIDHSTNDTLVLGLMALRVDPQKVLFPLIQTWTTPSKSAESLIIRKEGNEIVYLNELRHIKNGELLYKKSITTKNLAATMAIEGISGTVNAIDYRGIRVVAAMKKIPGTPWFMVAKIDRDEILSALNEQMTMGVIILALLILTSGLFLGFVLRNQRVRYYREKYENELDRLALVRHFDYILKYANDIILLIDKDLKIVEANDRASEIYMYTRNEIIGMDLENIRAPHTLIQFQEQLKRINDNESATFETFHKRKDGSIFPIEISTRVVSIEGAKYYQTIGRDITDRKCAEETLKESEEKFRKIFEESPFSMVMTGKDLVIVRANQSFCNMTGYDEKELKSFTFKNFTHPDYISKDEVSLMKLIAQEISIYHTEKKYIRKDGSILWGSTTISIIRNNKGEIQFFLGMVEDITSRKDTENALEKSFSLLKATLDSTADGLLVVDSEGKIVQFNQKYKEMWGIPEKIHDTGNDNEALEFVKNQLIDSDSFLNNVKHLYAEPGATTFDLLEFKDGRFFERYSQPQKIIGNSVGRVWSFRDITQRKRAEQDLISAKEKAEESDRLKTAFLHNVSHEIRTPMNAIIGFSSLLNEEGLVDQERIQYTDIISQSGTQLLSIINDIVDIASIEAGQIKVNMRMMNVNSTLRSLNDQFRIKERSPGVSLNLKIDLDDEKSQLLTDTTKLIQVISNLLNNAFKFTIKGNIDFGYNLKDDYFEFFVNDTGIGIPEEHQKKIFERFYQVDGAKSRQFGGTGLGLSICKAYIELLGGNIWLTSQPGKGTKFSFTIPYKIKGL